MLQDYKKSWKVIVIAVKIIDRVLCHDYGFKNILWVFSGRRGVHAWVADERAFALDWKARNAIVAYLSPLRDMQHPFTRLFDNPSHLHDDKVLCELCHEILEDQDMLAPAAIEKTLRTSCGTLSPATMQDIAARTTHVARWECIENVLTALDDDANAQRGLQRLMTMTKRKEARQALMHIRFDSFYPRLDAAVSRSPGHLLKVLLFSALTVSLISTTLLALAILLTLLLCTVHLLVARHRPPSVFTPRPPSSACRSWRPRLALSALKTSQR